MTLIMSVAETCNNLKKMCSDQVSWGDLPSMGDPFHINPA